MSLLIQIADRVLNTPLMILPDKLAVIANALSGRIGIDVSGLVDQGLLQSSARASAREQINSARPYATTPDGVAIIGIGGTLVNRGAWIGAQSGITSYQALTHQITTATADQQVRAIILDIDSPGGEVNGNFECAATIRQAREKKPVIAMVNGMAASAAYALAAAASKIVMTPSSKAGSIGVVTLHADYSRQLDAKGVTPTLIHAGAKKVDGNSLQPLPASVRADIQRDIDRYYAMFCDCVGVGRGSKFTSAQARATEARMYIGAEAVAAGLADEIGSIETAVGGRTRTSEARAEAYSPAELAAVINGKAPEAFKPAPHKAASLAVIAGDAFTPEELADRINATNRRKR